MSHSIRLLLLLQNLSIRRRPIGASKLATELNVSERTIYRDLAERGSQGVRIDGNPGGGYAVQDRLAEEYSKNRSVVTDTIVAYCLLELKEPGLKLDYVSYDALKTGLRKEDLILQVPGLGSVELIETNPATGKVPSLMANGRKTIGGNVKRPQIVPKCLKMGEVIRFSYARRCFRSSVPAPVAPERAA